MRKRRTEPTSRSPCRHSSCSNAYCERATWDSRHDYADLMAERSPTGSSKAGCGDCGRSRVATDGYQAHTDAQHEVSAGMFDELFTAARYAVLGELCLGVWKWASHCRG